MGGPVSTLHLIVKLFLGAGIVLRSSQEPTVIGIRIQVLTVASPSLYYCSISLSRGHFDVRNRFWARLKTLNSKLNYPGDRCQLSLKEL